MRNTVIAVLTAAILLQAAPAQARLSRGEKIGLGVGLGILGVMVIGGVVFAVMLYKGFSRPMTLAPDASEAPQLGHFDPSRMRQSEVQWPRRLSDCDHMSHWDGAWHTGNAASVVAVPTLRWSALAIGDPFRSPRWGWSLRRHAPTLRVRLAWSRDLGVER